MWIDSSCRPIHRGVYCTTLVGVISTCVGKQTVARGSGGWRGRRRPARTAGPSARRPAAGRQRRHRPRRPPSDRPSAPSHAIHVCSPVTSSDVKLFPDVCRTARPALPGLPARKILSGKPIRYYRPTGQPGDPASHRRRIPGVQRRRGCPRRARSSPTRCWRPSSDTTIGLTIAGAHDAGRARRLRHRADGPRARRLHHLDRRESLSRPALRAELHAAPRLAVRRRRRAVRGGRHPDLRRAVSRRRCCSRPTRTSATSSCARA